MNFIGWLVALVLLVLLLAHPAYFARDSVYIALSGLVFAVWVVFLLGRAREFQRFLPSRPVLWCLTALGSAALLAWILSEAATWEALFLLGAQFLFLWIGWCLGGHRAMTRRLGLVLVAGGGLAGVYALLQYLQFDPLPPGTAFENRIVSFFENPNNYGDFTASLLPLGLAFFSQVKSRLPRLGLLLLVGLLYTGLLLAAGRGAWWSALAGCLVFAAGYGWQAYRGLIEVHWKWVTALVLMLGAITVLLAEKTVVQVPTGPVSLGERMLSSTNIVGAGATQDATINHRYYIWQVTWEMIEDHPLRGNGLGAYPRRFVEVRKALQERGAFPVSWWNTHFDALFAHNEYMQIWAENGLLGLAGFVGLIAVVGVKALRAGWTANCERLELWGSLGLVGVLLVDSLVNYPLHLPLNSTLFWLTLGKLAND